MAARKRSQMLHFCEDDVQLHTLTCFISILANINLFDTFLVSVLLRNNVMCRNLRWLPGAILNFFIYMLKRSVLQLIIFLSFMARMYLKILCVREVLLQIDLISNISQPSMDNQRHLILRLTSFQCHIISPHRHPLIKVNNVQQMYQNETTLFRFMSVQNFKRIARYTCYIILPKQLCCKRFH